MIALALAAAILNPDVTPENIHQTICVPGWSASVRPPSGFTAEVKRKMLPPGARPSAFVLDHIEPISLGGAPRDLRNLQLQTVEEARRKDRIERELHQDVCDGWLHLKNAQRQILEWKP